jgi:hypothetical protein
MAYIGRTPAYGAFEKQTLTADSSTTTFALNFTVGSSSSVLVSVAGVIQEPEVGYSLSGGGANIIFSTAPTSGDTVFVVFLGLARDVDNISSTGTITNKTELAEQRADDDLFLVYDTSAGVLKKIQASNVASDLDIDNTTALAEEPASGDKFIVYDATAGANRAVEYQYINPSLTYTNGTFTGDGSTTAFTIDSGRAVNDVMVSQNGFLLVPTDDYTISGTTLTFATAPVSGAEISVRYLPLAGASSYTNDTATGDGSTTAFTIDSGRSVEDVMVSVNGVVFVPTDDYTISGTTLTFTVAPASSAEISIRYLRLT